VFDDQRRNFRHFVGKRCAPVLTIAAIAVAAPLAAHEVTVKQGDTLGAISAETGVPVARLAAYNGIKNPNLIYVGQVLQIPPVDGELQYTVAPGDTLGRIARQFDSTVEALAGRNGIADVDRIVAGRSLVIPQPGVTPTPATSEAPANTAAPTTAAPTTTAAPAPDPAPATVPPTTASPTTAAPTTAAPTTAAPTTAAPTTAAPTLPPATTVAPATTAAPSGPAPGVVVSTIWLIQNGDTVTSIAGKVGVTPARLAEANGIAVSTQLVPGRYLYVPQR
jgi:LysM repeat protein